MKTKEQILKEIEIRKQNFGGSEIEMTIEHVYIEALEWVLKD